MRTDEKPGYCFVWVSWFPAVCIHVYLWLLSLLFAIGANLAMAEEFNARVIAVMDGDTIMVLRGKSKIKIRLANIDAPEEDQTFGMQSRQSLLDLVHKKQVHIKSQAVDKYGRSVATVSVDGLNVNEEQVRRGMAWEYSHFHHDRGYIALQSEAQQTQRGLWAQSSPMAPWQWRKIHPAVKPELPGVKRKSVRARSDSVYSGSRSKPGQTEASSATSGKVWNGEANCRSKRHCSQMSSCDEAYYFLLHCGVKSLDRNRNGVPCENLCNAR